MKNTTENYSLFCEGISQASDTHYSSTNNDLKNLSVFYRLGLIYKKSENRPKTQSLIWELYKEFSFCTSPLPNSYVIRLSGTYSHRLLKKIMKKIGYRISPKPNCSNFHAWRIN